MQQYRKIAESRHSHVTCCIEATAERGFKADVLNWNQSTILPDGPDGCVEQITDDRHAWACVLVGNETRQLVTGGADARPDLSCGFSCVLCHRRGVCPRLRIAERRRRQCLKTFFYSS